MALNFVRQYNFRHSPTPTHSHRHLHAQVHRIIHNIHALKTIYNTNLNNLMDKGTRGENMASLLLWRKKCFEVESEVQREFLLERNGKSVQVKGSMIEIARERPVGSLVRGIWILRVSEAERRVQEDV